MAKCLRNLVTKEVIRVSKDEAAEKILSGGWKYADKDSWIRYKNDKVKSNGQKEISKVG